MSEFNLDGYFLHIYKGEALKAQGLVIGHDRGMIYYKAHNCPIHGKDSAIKTFNIFNCGSSEKGVRIQFYENEEEMIQWLSDSNLNLK